MLVYITCALLRCNVMAGCCRSPSFRGAYLGIHLGLRQMDMYEQWTIIRVSRQSCLASDAALSAFTWLVGAYEAIASIICTVRI
jgi:hypothetical protein